MLKQLGLITAVFLFVAGVALAEGPPVGSFKTVKGTASIVTGGQTVAASVGMKVHQKDQVITGPDGSVGIIFKDNTRLSLGPNSQIVIDAYVFAPAEGNFSMVTRITRGTAAYISGKMGKLAPEAVRFNTPSASLTIRGTHFVARVKE